MLIRGDVRKLVAWVGVLGSGVLSSAAAQTTPESPTRRLRALGSAVSLAATGPSTWAARAGARVKAIVEKAAARIAGEILGISFIGGTVEVLYIRVRKERC